MSTFIVLIGFLLIIASIVFLIMGLVKKNLNKKRIIIMAVSGIILFIGGASSSTETVDINGEKVKYEELVSKIEKKEKELSSVESKLKDVNTEYAAKKEELTEALGIMENIDKTKKELTGLQTDLKKVNAELKKKKSELASVEGQIIEKNEAPKILSAGQFTVGTDIPEGRYKVVPNGGSGNFFVNQGVDVNIMLGNGDMYESEYVFYANEGDEIELTTSAKFIPVE